MSTFHIFKSPLYCFFNKSSVHILCQFFYWIIDLWLSDFKLFIIKIRALSVKENTNIFLQGKHLNIYLLVLLMLFCCNAESKKETYTVDLLFHS